MIAADMPPPAPDVLVFTDAAAGKVGELIREEANPKGSQFEIKQLERET